MKIDLVQIKERLKETFDDVLGAFVSLDESGIIWPLLKGLPEIELKCFCHMGDRECHWK